MSEYNILLFKIHKVRTLVVLTLPVILFVLSYIYVNFLPWHDQYMIHIETNSYSRGRFYTGVYILAPIAFILWFFWLLPLSWNSWQHGDEILLLDGTSLYSFNTLRCNIDDIIDIDYETSIKGSILIIKTEAGDIECGDMTYVKGNIKKVMPELELYLNDRGASFRKKQDHL